MYYHTKSHAIKYGILFFYLMVSLSLNAQNYVPILSTDTHKDIVHKAAYVIPSARQLRWQELELTAFLHFGINTFTDKEWGNGHDDISIFNPKNLNANQWIATLKNVGFKQVILTAKHHDGFCLWPTLYTDYSIQNTPYKNGKGDIVKEVAEACRRYKMGFGIYLSPWDRHSDYYGDSAKYNDYFINQLTELLTNYGKVDEVWFDGANGEGPNGKKQWYDFDRWYALIRKLQPQAIIANMGPDARWVGTESGVGRITEWSVLPLNSSSQKQIAAKSQKDIYTKPEIKGNASESNLGSREKLYNASGLIWYPAETDVSIRPGWFYHAAEDSLVKTPEQLMKIYFTSVGRNSVLLLNIPPDKNGLLNHADINSLKLWKQNLDKLFHINLAQNAKVFCTNGIGTETLFDNKMETYFTTKEKDTTASIVFSLPSKKNFNVIKMQEDIQIGQRIENFNVEAEINGGWQQIDSGMTIGYKRLLVLKDSITTDKIRINILSSRLNPTLSEFGLYYLAQVQ